MIVFFLFATAILLLIDLYGYKGIKMLTANLDVLPKRISRWAWWIPTIITAVLFIYLMIDFQRLMDTKSYKTFYFITGFAITFLVTKIVFVLFHFADDVVHIIRLLANWISPKQEINSVVHERINRLQFINQAGLIVSGVVFGSMIYGQTKGKYNFKVWKESIPFPHLPEAFDGAKIVQISDMHLGSFLDNSFEEVKAAIATVNSLEPDYIFFTGDMVNNYAYEADLWIDIIGELKAKRGKFSILGNHDYGDYVPWKDPESKKANLERLFEIHEEMGFRLLKNETAILEKDGQEIALIGVENWGQGFHQYGDLNKAVQGVSDSAFKILLSHDPTHFDQAVMGKTNIALTMSGHTHGMQMGIEIPSLGIKLSPIQLRYKRWAGLYKVEDQYLYVNRGFGFLGFPGRVGIFPEITLIELKKA
jgi:hypothetical protein